MNPRDLADEPHRQGGTGSALSDEDAKATLSVRTAKTGDAAEIVALVKRIYPKQSPYSDAQIRGQLNAFPEGQLVATFEGQIVGYAASFRIGEARAFADHDWDGITGNGFAARHSAVGDWLYGMEVCVDASRRNLKIGRRLYDARKRICHDFGLKGIVFAGRMPGYAKKAKEYPNPDDYLAAALDHQVKDKVVTFQVHSGFEPVRILRRYLPEDVDSGGHAVLMCWRNPDYDEGVETQPRTRRDPRTARVVTVQMQARPVKTREEFYDNVAYFVGVASDYEADFVVFPELFTLQMLAAEPSKLPPDQAIERLTDYTSEFVERLGALSIAKNVNIIGGSHPTRTDDGDIQNVGYVFLRDGSIHAQEKLHPTPDERYWWNIEGGDEINAIETDCGPIGVMICYDSEFPELGRRLVDQGARILFVPFCTDTRQGYLRVRYCCQARAIENQCYVVTSGNVGNLPHVENMDIQYAQSAVFTPCDFPFARDGIAAETSENIEMVAVADVDLTSLTWARHHGSVRNLDDRRFDLYRTVWPQRDGHG